MDWKKLTDLHHDFCGYLEENGIIQLKNKVVDEFGAYKADIIWNGKLIREKSFFPKHWARTLVVENILEAFDNFMARGIEPILERDGKWRINGNSKIGLKIEMIIDQKGNLLSAYPKI